MLQAHPPASAFHFTIELRRSGFVGGSQAVIEALVRLRAPARSSAAGARAPLTLALALDRSGSMAGRPLAQAKACARGIVESLGGADRAAIVAFDGNVEVMCPVIGIDQRARLLAAIDAVQGGASSDLHGGWLEAARCVGRSVAGFGFYRVIVLSDGRTNTGETDGARLANSCRDLASQGIATSTYGLGHPFNEDLMVELARAGNGKAHYGQTARELVEAFRAELASVARICARGLVLKVHAPPGVQVLLRNDYPCVDPSGASWKLPDLAFEGEAWAYLKLTVPSVYLAGPVVDLPLTVSIKAAGAGSPLYFMASLPPVERTTRAELMTRAPHPLVERRRDELAAAGSLELVRRLVARDHWRAALVHVENAERRFGTHPGCGEILHAMRGMVARRHRREDNAYLGAGRRTHLGEGNDSPAPAGELNVPAFLLRDRDRGKGRTPD